MTAPDTQSLGSQWDTVLVLLKNIDSLLYIKIQLWVSKPFMYMYHCVTELGSSFGFGLCIDINYCIISIHLNLTSSADWWQVIYVKAEQNRA